MPRARRARSGDWRSRDWQFSWRPEQGLAGLRLCVFRGRAESEAPPGCRGWQCCARPGRALNFTRAAGKQATKGQMLVTSQDNLVSGGAESPLTAFGMRKWRPGLLEGPAEPRGPPRPFEIVFGPSLTCLLLLSLLEPPRESLLANFLWGQLTKSLL